MSDIVQALRDPNAAVISDYSADSSCMLLLFGGIKLGIGMPPFEFFRLTEQISVKKLLVRDLHQAWYLRGLPGIANTVPEIAAWLRRETETHGIKRVVAVGNSMGGYAALLFGSLIGAHQVLAFSPQTFVAPRLLCTHRDFRWKWNRLRGLLAARGKFTDVRPVVQQHPGMTCDLFYCSEHRLDTAHARHLSDVPNVRLHPVTEGGHQLIKAMRDSGELKRLLTAALAG